MAQTVGVLLCGDDRARLEAIVADRNRRHKHVQRARIVLLSADRWSVAAIADVVGLSRPSVWRWQQRFAEEGVVSLLKDRTRPPGKMPFPEEIELKVVELTCSEPPGEVTHWTGRALAKVVVEGVETPDQLRLLERIGCDIAQGFFIKQPMPATEVSAWFERWQSLQPRRAS